MQRLKTDINAMGRISYASLFEIVNVGSKYQSQHIR